MLARGWCAALALAPLLAGCLGNGEGAEPAAATAPSTFAVTAGLPAPEPEPTTSVLRLRMDNGLTTVAPDSYTPVRVPIFSAQSLLLGEPRQTQWNFTWPADVGLIRGEAILVVDVRGTVVNSPYTAVGAGCFWILDIQVDQPGRDPTDPYNGGGCVEEPQVVPEGTRTLRIPFELPAAPYLAGFQASIAFGADAYAESADARIDLVTASIAQDSTITFEGVGWPLGLDRVTLLTTG